jgi:lipopolysaccharide transport system permease protein
MTKYLQSIWTARYFWLHLANAELKYKFRRSRLGLLWTMINPLLLMLMITLIFGNLFDIPMQDFAPYVFSGLIVWEFVLGSALGGCNSLLVSEAYIKQFRHPLVIYPLKTALVQVAIFLIAIQAMFLWVLVTDPTNLLLGILTLPITAICLFLLGWPIAILTSSINLKYRDFVQVLGLAMQLLWYISPVFFKPEMFKAKELAILLEYNPVTHILNLVRAPLLNGSLPSAVDFGFVFGLIAVLSLLAIWRMSRVEKTLVYYF